LDDLFPGSNHAFPLKLEEADDPVVWEHAEANGFMIVSKDVDFSYRSVLFGHPPNVIRIHLGNCATNAVETLLRDHFDLITAFQRDEAKSCRHLPPYAWLT